MSIKSKDLLELAEKYAKKADYESAKQCCNQYLTEYPSNKKALRLLAFIFSLNKEYSQAIGVANEIIDLCEELKEPLDHFNRGRWLYENGEYLTGVSDFSEVIRLCTELEDNYYLESAFLYRAIGFFALNNKDDALNDLNYVSEECSTFFLGKVQSKSILINDHFSH